MVNNKVSLILIFLLTFTVSTFSFAGAAEKWEYEPVMKNMNIEVKAHKVDQYGAAVNDYEYNTKIDPKTDANRTKMGKVGFGRLLRSTGWGLLGSAALQALLDSVGWIMDPESQSIWRNKKPDPNGSVNCSGGYLFRYQPGEFAPCPLAAVQSGIAKLNAQSTYYSYEFVRWQNNPLDPDNSRPTFTIRATEPNGQSKETPNQWLERKIDPNAQPAEKEYLTPQELADYANHTHPDYSNPELSPKLEPKYSPKIAEDLWKPANPWEETNSPTVQEVNKKLDEAQPEPKKDPELTPNPETGGMTLPSFCTWAVSVCEFIKWVKQDPEPENDEIDVDQDINEPSKVDLNFGSSCPAPVTLIDSSFYDQPFKIEFSFNDFCMVLSDFVRPVLIAMGAFIAALILGGVKTNE